MGKNPKVVIVGSGAGGATTAFELARAGIDVLVLEEGQREQHAHYGNGSLEAMEKLYRRRGMTPILGRVPMGYVEGCGYGGSTEINSGFWHRTPREILLRWQSHYELDQADPEDLYRHFEWAEAELKVGYNQGDLPASTRAFKKGIVEMGWSASEIPRIGPYEQGRQNSAPANDPRQSMSRTLLPQAEEAGANFMMGCRVRLLTKHRNRITGVLATLKHDDGSEELVRIDADAVIICAGATETPALLLRSGIRYNVGNSFRVHPMLKVAALFEDVIDAHQDVIPLLQVKEFWPDISMGGAFFSSGHLAMLLSENWPKNRTYLSQYRNMASYYVAVRGTGKGTVRSSRLGKGHTFVRYNLSDEDLRHLSNGFARLCLALLAAGAKEVIPSVYGLSPISSELQAVRWLDEQLPKSALSLTTVHAFSACPMGERDDRCAVNSFGQVRGVESLYVNDASMLPDSPGVNPQGTIMAFARRNVQHFIKEGL